MSSPFETSIIFWLIFFFFFLNISLVFLSMSRKCLRMRSLNSENIPLIFWSKQSDSVYLLQIMSIKIIISSWRLLMLIIFSLTVLSIFLHKNVSKYEILSIGHPNIRLFSGVHNFPFFHMSRAGLCFWEKGFPHWNFLIISNFEIIVSKLIGN